MSGTHSTLSNHHWWSYPLNADNPAQLTIDLNENYILTAGVGLAEVQFGGVIVPEPSTALLAAFAGLALARRRR